MKNFYFKKYIAIISILLASVFGGSGVMGARTVTFSGVNTNFATGSNVTITKNSTTTSTQTISCINAGSLSYLGANGATSFLKATLALSTEKIDSIKIVWKCGANAQKLPVVFSDADITLGTVATITNVLTATNGGVTTTAAIATSGNNNCNGEIVHFPSSATVKSIAIPRSLTYDAGTYSLDTKYANFYARLNNTATGTYTTVLNSASTIYYGELTLYISDIVTCAAATPTGHTSNTPQCVGTGVTLSSPNSAAGGETWYWQTSATGTSTANPTPYTTTTSGTYYLRSYHTAGTCWGTATSGVAVVVDPASVGGTATAGSATICTGSTTTISLSGNTGSGIQWQQSADGSSGWANVTGGSGATTATYTTPALTSTTYYRAVVTSGTCASDNSSTASVTISATSVGGTTSGASSICSGNQPGSNITLSGNTGSITKWQKSTVSDFSSSVTDIVSTANPLTAATIGTLTATTYFRAVVANGACAAANSAGTTVTVQATSATPVVTSPIANGATSASGTSTEADGTSIEVFIGGVSQGTTTVSSNAWTKTGLTLSTGNVVTAQATASGKCVSATSAGVTVTAACTNPTIDTQPSTGTQTLCVGGTPTNLTIATTGATGYQWYSSVDGALGSDTNLGSADGAQTATYTPSTASASALYYFCIVSDGACTTTSNMTGLITVNAAPSISAQPNNATAIVSGAATTMSVTASNATGYQWQYCSTSGGTYNNVVNGDITGITYSGATSATLSITAGGTASAGTGYYKCVVSGTAPCAAVTSNYGTLTISTSTPAIKVAYITKTSALALASDGLYQYLNGNSDFTVTVFEQTAIGATKSAIETTLATYDVVLISEAVDGTNANVLAAEGIDKPMVNGKNFLYTLTSRWNWGTPSNGAASTLELTATNTSHPIYAGLTFTGSNVTLSNALDTPASDLAIGYVSGATMTITGTSLGYSESATDKVAIQEMQVGASGSGTTITEPYILIAINKGAYDDLTNDGKLLYANAIKYVYKPQIYATTSANGTISPSGVTQFTRGNNQTYTMTADGGFQVYDVLVDGVSVGAVTSYTFTNITESHTIAVSYGVTCSNPTIDVQPSAAGQTLCKNANATDLSVTASGTTLTYQWYSNTSAANTGGTLLTGATNATYDPSTATAGTLYYYCIVKSNGGCPVTTNVTGAIVSTALPAISSQSTATATYAINDAATAITVSATGTATLTYQWYSSTNTTIGDGDDVNLVAANGAQTNSYTPQTGSAGTLYYYCIVSSTTCATPVTSAISGAIITSAPIVAPTTQATNITFSSVTTTSMTIGLTRGNGSSVAIFVKAGAGAITNPSDGTTYTASTNFASPTGQLGTSGYYCVYNGAGAPPSVTVTGLTASTTYTVQAFEYNGSAATSKYYTATATNNPNTQATSATPSPYACEGFEAAAWTAIATGSGTTATVSSGTGDWYVYNSKRSTVAHAGTNSMNPSSSGSYIKTPTLSNGLGTITFWAKYGVKTILVEVYNASNALIADSTYTVSATWTEYTFPVSSATASYVKFIRGSDNNVTIDDICLTAYGVPATVTTQVVDNISTTSATGHGTITNLGDGVTTSGIVWGTSTTPTVSLTTKTTNGPTTAIAYTGAIGSLTANTLYYVRAYATGAGGTGYGNQETFTTLPLAPTVAAESSITSTSFVANWSAPTQGSASFTYSVEVALATDPTFVTPVQSYSSIASGTTNQAVSGLSASTNYIYRVKIVNAEGSGDWSGSEAVTTGAPSAEINITQAGNSYLDGTSTYAFGEVTNSTTSDVTFTIQNTGAGTLTLSSSAVTGTGFSLQTAPGTTIAGGATETFVVRFSPVATTSYTGTITIVSNDADEATYTISLTGSGTTNLTAPGSLVSSAPATDGFTLGWNTVGGVDGYEVKVCQVNTSTTLINQTDMSTWTSFPATNCTQVIDFKADHLGTVSQSTADGTFTIYNSINGESSTCQYIQMGKTAQTALNAQGFWDGNSVDDIDADGVKDGGFIVFPTTASAGTLTLSVSSTGTSGRTFAIQKSLDGGTTWSLVANSDANSSTAVTRTITVNEPAECILRLKVTASNIVRVHSIALTSYMLCATPVVKAGQATNSHTFTGLNPNNIYYYSARSYQTAGPTYSNWTTLSALNTEVTLPLAPATSSVTGITTTGMTINWTAPATVGTQTYTYTVEYSTASDYSGAVSLAGIPSGTLSQVLTGLTMNQLYYYRVRCENVSGGGAWITGSATTLASVPTVTTTTVSAVEQTTATSGGNVTNNGGSAIINMGLVYHTSANPTTANSFVDEPGNTTGAFTSLLTGLAPNTIYYYRAYAENAQGAAYGTESSFVTKPNSPNIGAANTATPVGFTANWTAPTIPGNQTYTYTVEVSTNSADFTSPVASASGIASGTTTYVFNSLLSNTEYFFRVKAVNATGSSDYVVQTTGVTTDAGAPAVTTTVAASTTTTSTIWGGDVTSNGGTTVSERGIVYNTSASPTILNSKDDNGSGLGVFSETNSALIANTKYYYRAYATGVNGYTGYGTEYNLTTLPAAPTATAATTATGSGFTATWTAPTHGSEAFTYDVIVSATSNDYTTPAASYIGILSSDLSKVVTGLNASTTYYYKVRAVNATGESAWSNEITTATIAQKTLTATFSNGTVTANGISLTSGVAANFSVNEEVILTATPAANYGFLRWVINGVDQISDNPYTVTLTDNTTVSAVFGGASCATSAFDAACNLSTSNVTNTVFTDGTDSWLGIAAVRLNTSSSYSHSGNNSIRLYGNLGAVATYATNRPVAIKFWARMYNTSNTGNIKVYMSTDGGSNYDATPIINQSVTGASWVQYTANVNTTSTNVKFKIFNGTGNSSTSYDIVVDDVEICTGPDAVAPTFTFVPTSGATGVLLNADIVATASEALYRYYPATGAFVQLTTAALAGMSADSITQFMSLRNVLTNAVIPAAFSIDATGKIITVNPTSDFPAYNTQYKLSISNVADASQNITATTQYTQFTTRPDPVPEILIEEVASSTEVADDGSVNMGTIISGTYVEKTFRITNTALLDPLTISACSFGTGTKYTIEGTNPTAASPLAAGTSTTFVVRFTPGATPGNFTDVLTITNNDPNEGTYAINFTGNKAAFVLPYTFESGCTTPIVSATELKHDYTSLSDIPAEISLNNGALFDADHFFVDYSVFHVEGNCMPSGSTALRIGQGNNSLEIESATQGVGKVTVKWCANGYRKIRITDELGNVYIQSPTYQAGENCYTSSAVVNRSGAVTVDVEFIGTDPALLTTVYFLEVTPYNPALKSSAKNIIDISTNIATEQVRIYDDVVFISVPNTNPLNAITTDLLKVSPFATVSPGLGTQNYSAGPVNYTVTAEDGTTKVYKVYVEHIPVYTGYYRDTVEWTTLMNSQDQIIEVIEISNESCTVPVSGNGSAYTLYFLDSGDLPQGGYNIGGLSQVCIGSTVQYSLTNAPATNSPNYTWTLTGEDIDLFTVVGATTQEFDRASTPVGIDSIIVDQSLETLTLQAPNEMTTADLSIKISVQFDPTCTHVEGDTEFTINVTEDAPLAVDTVIASCVENGLLTLTAKGAGASATTYGWTFSNPQTIVSQTDSTITLNIGTSVSDVVAEVVTQNGCGYTASTQANNVVYGTPLSEWTGTTSSAWDNTANWTGRVPQACTNVIIPNVNVPGVEYPTIGTSGVCHYITFEPGGAVLGIEKLDYTKAFVQLELNRDKWYTLTSPLKEMYSGDYFFSGAPVTNMKLFDAINPDSLTRGGTITEGTFTRSFSASNVELTAGKGFAYNVTQKTWDYPNGSTNVNTPQELTFPRMNADSSLFVNYIPYSALNGKPNLYKITTVSKDADSSYRFAIEDGNGNIPSTYTITIPTGKSLIGNPVMTHLNITDFLTRNAAVLNPDNIRLWTGTTYISYSGGTWSGGGYTGNFIAPMQSFVVESTTGGDIDFVIPDDFGADDDASALRLCPVNQNMLHIESQNGVASAYATVTLNKDAKNEFDTQDVDKLFTPLYEVADVYTLSSNTALDFNRFNKYPYTTPLGIRSSNYGKTTLKFRGANTFADAEVYLVNTATNEKVNLKEQASYEFDLTAENGEGTLFLEFRSASTTTGKDEVLENGDIQIFTKEGNIVRVISAPQDLIQEVVIMDETGRVILINKNLNVALFDTTLNNGSKVVMVKVTTQNGVKTAKVLIK